MKYVLDASVVLNGSCRNRTLRRHCDCDDAQASIHTVVSPDVLSVEIGHALTKAERQRRIAPGQAWVLWQVIMVDAPQLIESRAVDRASL